MTQIPTTGKAAAQALADHKQSARSGARLHPILELHTLSAAAKRGLMACGIRWAEDLLSLSATAMSSLADAAPNIGPASLAQAVSEARWIRLSGVDGPAAARLVAAGYQRYSDLVFGNTSRIAHALAGPSQSDKDPVALERATAVQLDAARRSATTTIRLTITDARHGRALKDAIVFLGGMDARGHRYFRRRRTNKRGRVLFDYVRPGMGAYVIVIEARDRLRMELTAPVVPGGVVHFRVPLQKGTSVPDVDELKGDLMPVLTGGEVRRLRRVKRATSLPKATPLRISSASVAGSKKDTREQVLVSVWRRVFGRVIETPTVAIPEDALPPRWHPGMLVRRSGRGKYLAIAAAEAKTILSARNGYQLAKTTRSNAKGRDR